MPVEFLVIQKSARKRLLKLPIEIHKRIVKSFDQIRANPIIGAKLHGELSGYYKFRVGDYRIMYRFDSKEKRVDVVKIEHRQGVYR